jgi:hypothetical protein
MTFKEAIDFKAKMNYESYQKDGITFHVFITPAKPDDFTTYCEEIRSHFNFLKDEYAIKYSSDDSFSIRGLCYYRKSHVLHDTLKE